MLKITLLNVVNNEKESHTSTGTGTGSTFQQQCWYWYRHYFIAKVLLLVLTIVFTSIVNIPACRGSFPMNTSPQRSSAVPYC